MNFKNGIPFKFKDIKLDTNLVFAFLDYYIAYDLSSPDALKSIIEDKVKGVYELIKESKRWLNNRTLFRGFSDYKDDSCDNCEIPKPHISWSFDDETAVMFSHKLPSLDKTPSDITYKHLAETNSGDVDKPIMMDIVFYNITPEQLNEYAIYNNEGYDIIEKYGYVSESEVLIFDDKIFGNIELLETEKS